MLNSRPNPYVGPRSFQTGEKLYGRERETLELLDLLIAERIVLLYSPSGAGKTSLIQAALVPKLREEGFNVLRPMRVSVEPPVMPPPPGSKPERAAASRVNRFVLSAMLSLEERLPKEKRTPLAALASMSFDAYLAQFVDSPDSSPVLIFDQFEEILTLDATNLDAKYAFFEQVGEALRNRGRWALFSMREDYLAGLDPFLRPIPTRFATTYRLDLLGVNAAREAIQKPARSAGVEFSDPAANKLVDDLRRVQVQRPDGTMETQPGLYVEPVQLQVVCFRLWNKLPDAKNSILESDLADVGDVSTALADYYSNSVQAVARNSGVSERIIREWFDRQLITEQGIRGQVLMEPEKSRGLANQTIRLLEDAHLVRADERRGATWFELAHDRLIEPVRTNNAAWFQENLSALQQQADLWERQDRPDGLLLQGKALLDAEAWAQAHSDELSPTEQAFLSECRAARLIHEKEAKQNRRIRYLAIGATVLSAIALLGVCATLFAYAQLGDALNETDQARATAVANEQEANTQKQIALTQDRVSKMTSAALSQLSVDPEVSLLLATEAYSTTHNIQTDDALRQALVESRVRGTLRGHDGSVNAVAVSPDGKLFLTGSGDDTLRLWDAARGKALRALTGHTAPIWGAAFSPDGKRIVSASEDKTARLWDLTNCLGNDSAECPSTVLSGHGNTVWNAAFSPDGKWIVTGSEDTTAKIWDAASGRELRSLTGHDGAVNAVAFSPDGHSVVTASSDQTARLWDIRSCLGDSNADCPFKPLTAQSAVVWNAAFSPDGKSVVVAADDQNAYKYDAETGSVTNYLIGHNDAVFGVAYSPDGKYFATGSRDGTARIWDASTGQTISVLRGHESTIWNVAFTPDSKLLLTGSADKTAKLWMATDGIEMRVLRGHLNKVLGADYSGDGRRVITVGADGDALVWDAATGETVVPPLTGHTNWVADGALNEDGTRAATASFDTTARVWDLTRCQSECPFVELVGHKDTVRGIAFSPDAKWVLTASDDGTARLWDAETGKEKLELQGHVGGVNHAVFSQDGRYAVTAGADYTARLWDIAAALNSGATTAQAILILRGHEGPVTNASFNADGTLVVTASDDRTARVWDVAAALKSGAASAQEKSRLRGHTGSLTGAEFSRDGKFIVTSSSDKTARLWNAVTGQEQSVLRGHTDKVQTVELSPDDRFVLTSSSDRTARIALVSIDEILALARTRVTRALSCDEWQIILQESNFCPGGGVAQNAENAFPTSAPITRVAAAGAPAETATPVPTTAPQSTETLAPTAGANPTVDLSKPSGGGAGATPEATNTVPPSLATATLAAAPTRAEPPTAVPPSPTPALAPGVYVSNIVFTPINPGQSPASGEFRVTFLNNTGAETSVTRWKVLIFEPGSTKSFGDTQGLNKNFPAGSAELLTAPYRVGLGQCQNYVGKVVSEDSEGRQTPFLRPDGQPAAIDFQLCP